MPPYYIDRLASGPDLSARRPAFVARSSSIRTDGTPDLPKCPTRALVDAFNVGLGCGDALKSAGVGLDSVNQHMRRNGGL